MGLFSLRSPSLKPFSFKEITLKDLFLIFVPAVVWVAATYARPSLITPNCIPHPEMCTKESILKIDQFSFGLEDMEADGYSYFTQNTSVALGIAVPPLWNAARIVLGQTTPWGALIASGTDLVLVGQTLIWNGLFTELSHILGRRPRPFVYQDPALRGQDPSHYTSFYSGHTSSAAAATTIVLLLLSLRGAPTSLLILWGGVMQSLIFSTAYFRILAGRHFLTDVICGALAGSLIALTVVRRKLRKG